MTRATGKKLCQRSKAVVMAVAMLTLLAVVTVIIILVVFARLPTRHEVRPTYGDYICADLSCKLPNGETRRNGESWCVYDMSGKAGNADDPVGSRHYRAICINGEVIVEPCADYRQEICIQDSIETEGGKFLQAACRANRWQDCVQQETKEDCENTDRRDCVWLEAEEKCVPAYPPGLKFWEEGDAQGICAQGNAKCVVTFEKGLFGGEKCKKNCECLTDEWRNKMNNICKSLGDCGSYINWLGVETEKGTRISKGRWKPGEVIAEVFRPVTGAVVNIVGGIKPIISGYQVNDLENTKGNINRSEGDTLTGNVGNTPRNSLFNFTWKEIGKSLAWAAGVSAAIYMFGQMFGFGKQEVKAASIATFSGFMSWKLASKISSLKNVAPWIGIGVGLLVFALLYKKEKKKVVVFECLPWQPPVGGADCEKCNEAKSEEGLSLACSEYKCRSLGQACQLVNPGTSEEKCVWVNPHDVTSPTIEPNEAVLTHGYAYQDVKIRPPGWGFRIVRLNTKDGCIKAFEPLQFGIVTNEPAACKIDYNHTKSFDEMRYWFGGTNLLLYNHTQRLALPGPEALEQQAPELQNDGTYTLYVRCRDANGNYNEEEFAIRFCVEKGPDTTPPQIMRTSIESGMPIAYNTTSLEITLYVNEPAECRWSREDKDYEQMENNMTCATNIWQTDNGEEYACSAVLTGLKDRQENVFYFRCKDQPWAEESERNVNRESYKLVLVGTEPLSIIKAEPNNTVIKGSGDVVTINLEVETDYGYKNGEATCYYSTTPADKDYIAFFETGSNKHKQSQYLTEGKYTYYIKCIDLGGNTAYTTISFTVETDNRAPIITRVYRDGDKLAIITDENATCTYSTEDCNFKLEDGINMPYENSKEHYAEWKLSKTYYIKCMDEYGNQPLPTECSIVVRGFRFATQE